MRTGFTNTGTGLHILDENGRALCGRFIVTIIRKPVPLVGVCRQCKKKYLAAREEN